MKFTLGVTRLGHGCLAPLLQVNSHIAGHKKIHMKIKMEIHTYSYLLNIYICYLEFKCSLYFSSSPTNVNKVVFIHIIGTAFVEIYNSLQYHSAMIIQTRATISLCLNFTNHLLTLIPTYPTRDLNND